MGKLAPFKLKSKINSLKILVLDYILKIYLKILFEN